MAMTNPNEVTNAELTEIYNKANGHAGGKLKPITTATIFAAMRACLAAAQPVPQAADNAKALDE